MQLYWGYLCEHHDEQKLGHMVQVLHTFAAAKRLAGHFLLVLKFLLKMTIVGMRQQNSALATCPHSELHIVMDRQQVTVSKNQEDSALDINVVGMAKCSSQNCLDMSLASAQTPYSKKWAQWQAVGTTKQLDMILVLIAIVPQQKRVEAHSSVLDKTIGIFSGNDADRLRVEQI